MFLYGVTTQVCIPRHCSSFLPILKSLTISFMSLSVHRFSLSLYSPHHLSVKDPGLTDLRGWGTHRLDSRCHIYICAGQHILLLFVCGKLAVYGNLIRYIRLTAYISDFWLRCQINSVGENEVCLIFEQLVLEQLSIYRDLKKKKSSSYFTLCRKVSLRWIKGLIVIVRPQSCWKKTGRQSLCSWGEQFILRQDLAQSTGENGVKRSFPKLKTSAPQRTTVRKYRGKPQ